MVESFRDSIKNLNFREKCEKTYTMDNIQARTRATILFGISNEYNGCISIATSDKSEAYMGYATINGDMSGGFAPIADITKTKLFALARWLNKNRVQKNAIPQSVIDKRPGAELAINPKTGKPLMAEEALMPYDLLDEVIWRIEILHQAKEDMMKDEFLYEKSNKINALQKKEWLDKFFCRMQNASCKGNLMPVFPLVDEVSINKKVYNSPITTKINFESISL
jgi:NAD+ synthase/NAD+ synthase (glutamine-hydrolysing)